MNIFIGLVLIGIVIIAVWAMINKKEKPVDVIKEIEKAIEPVKPEPVPEPVKEEVIAKVKKPKAPRKTKVK